MGDKYNRFDASPKVQEIEKMKNIIDFNRLQDDQKKKKSKNNPANTKAHTLNKKDESVIPLHAMLKNELKLYRGSSKSDRLGVLRKYDELIAMARKK